MSGRPALLQRAQTSRDLTIVPTHDHEWRLRAVWHEDGVATEEYACVTCPGVTFR